MRYRRCGEDFEVNDFEGLLLESMDALLLELREFRALLSTPTVTNVVNAPTPEIASVQTAAELRRLGMWKND